MNEVPSPRELRGAAAVAQTLAYMAGAAGVVAGAIAYQDGQTILAVVAWILTFAIGAILIIASFLVRASAAVLARLAHLESDMQVLLRDRASQVEPPIERDPWRRH